MIRKGKRFSDHLQTAQIQKKQDLAVFRWANSRTEESRNKGQINLTLGRNSTSDGHEQQKTWHASDQNGVEGNRHRDLSQLSREEELRETKRQKPEEYDQGRRGVRNLSPERRTRGKHAPQSENPSFVEESTGDKERGRLLMGRDDSPMGWPVTSASGLDKNKEEKGKGVHVGQTQELMWDSEQHNCFNNGVEASSKGEEPSPTKSGNKSSGLGEAEGREDTGQGGSRKEIETRALGSLVKTDTPITLTNFHDAIAKAMKEAMSAQFNDWFGTGKDKVGNCTHKEGGKSEDCREGNSENRESGSQASHAPATNVVVLESQGEIRNQDTDIGSLTKELLFEAGEQFSRERKLSRERKQEVKEDREHEK